MVDVLEIRGLTKHFGGFAALADVSFSVRQGTLHSVIGPNGAGKTTLFNLLSGVLKPTAGKIFLRGRDITGLPPHRIARMGIGRAFQLTHLFPNLTVLENVRLAVQAQAAAGRELLGEPGALGSRALGGTAASGGPDRLATQGPPGTPAPRKRRWPARWVMWQSEERVGPFAERAAEIVAKVGLAGKEHVPAHALSHGDQRKLDLGMALALDPDVLLLDEPTAGVSREEVPAIVAVIEEIRREGRRTILLVEHKMEIVLNISDRITVLQYGRFLAEGTPAEIVANPAVQAAYLGDEYGQPA
ncbi:MAG: hypothetical protein BAA04_02415 [Firmicutes bacterium ZCTH02-B6]|nr:MAG: hypothetical protein BAA04_02415 [Firmicutes bacterium ZCTH02-B6]